MRWYVKVTTPAGCFYVWAGGYATQQEAEQAAALAREILLPARLQVQNPVTVEVEQW